MVLRVKAILRRIEVQTNPVINSLLKLAPDSFRVSSGEQAIELTSIEFWLLQVLYDQPGRIFSRSKLMDLIYQDQRIVCDRTIDSHIKKLRKKLLDLLPEQELIHSVYGAGYRYEPRKRVIE